MNKICNRFLRTFLITIYLFVAPAYVFATNIQIEIDQSMSSLVAPEACSYQWYKNGEQIKGGTDRYLSVKDAGNYTVEIIDEIGNINESRILVSISATGAIIKIILIGDSTVANWGADKYPEMGWGQVFQYYFNSSNIQVLNFAISGTTTVSFYGRSTGWVAAKNSIANGDYVLIQFGHNDQKTEAGIDAYGKYQEYLTKYVNEIKAKGGIPVFVTSVNRNLWTGTTFNDKSLAEYPEAMRQLGKSLNVPVIDLNARSAVLFSSLGQSYLSNFVFNNYAAGEYPNYPSGLKDQTHFSEMGAIEVSRLVIEGIAAHSALSLKALVPFLKPVYEVVVTVNPKASATLTTRTASYPSEMNITLKTVPKTNSDFTKWNDAASKSVSTKFLYSFTMGDKPTFYTAVYKGAILELDEELNTDFTTFYPNPFTTEFQINVTGIFEFSISDMNGIEVQKGTALNNTTLGKDFNKGIYMLKIHTEKGARKMKVIKN